MKKFEDMVKVEEANRDKLVKELNNQLGKLPADQKAKFSKKLTDKTLLDKIIDKDLESLIDAFKTIIKFN